MPVDCPVTTARSPTQRSRATNGKTLFACGGDMRGPWARRLRDIMDLHVSDLGGDAAISESQRCILRRASAITVELERIEAKFAVGEGDELLDIYSRVAGNLRRLLETLGLERQARDVTLGFDAHVAATAKRAEPAQDEPATAEPYVEAGTLAERTGEHAAGSGA